jgi:Flp pilus assembly protein TadG
MATSPAPQRARRARPNDERGIAALWLALTLFLLLGVAAIAVDLVHATLEQQKAQNAADAAALGGVVYLPGDPTTATSTALKIAGDNGFTNNSTTVVTAAQDTVPSRLKVEVKTTFPTFFARILGVNTLTVHKSATADYDQPVAMGSPANTFGNQPDCSSPCTNTTGADNPQLWFNIAGPNSEKVQGDAFAARLCNIDGNSAADNCPGNVAGNTDYDGNGYSYDIRNTNPGGLLKVDVFDPAFIGVNDQCDNASLTSLYNARVAAHDPDAARYTPGANDPHCSGDQYFGYASGYGDIPPTTTYTLSYDPGTPWTTADDVVQCTKTFSGYKDDLLAGYNSNPSLTTGNFRSDFRKWVNICQVSPAQGGDYVLNITTSSGTGHNRGAIRASLNNSLNTPALSIFARSRMSIYANRIGANTQFYLARVFPGAAGRTLTITFYDTGDASQAGTIKVIPPAESTLSSFSGCKYTPPPGNSTGPPWGTFQATSGSDCSQSGINAAAGWNGQWVSWEVPIPASYNCDATSASGCWIKLQFSYPSGTVSDTTTWTASLNGNPVRLVQ